MSEEKDLVSAADHDVFASAFETELEQQKTAAEAVDQPLLDHAITPRDEKGRFAAAEQVPVEQKAEEVEEPEQKASAEAERREPPEFRFREVSEARRQAEQRASALEEQNRQLMAMLQQGRQAAPQALQPEQQEPDIIGALLENPQAFLAQRDAQMLDMIGVTMARSTPEGAKAYDEAYETLAALRQQNPAAFQSTYASLMGAHPLQRPQALMNWHKVHMTQQRVGDDPDAFFSRTLEERLSDPVFAAQLVEKLTGRARQQPPTAAKPAIDLPPSLSRTTSAAPATAALGDMTDASLFQNALSN